MPQSHKIWSACGTMKWSVSPVFVRMAHVTVVCTFETCINQKSVIYLFIICGVIAALEALIGLCHTIFFLLYAHVQLQHAHGSEGDIYERLDLSVSFVSASCACDWSEGSLYMSNSVKVCCWLKVCGFISEAIKSSGYCWCSRVQ